MPHDKDFFNVDWEEEDSDYITPLQEEALDKVATEVVSRQMAMPAIMFLESVRPLNWLASQMMLFFEPFYAWIFGFKQIIDLRRAFQKRESIPLLIEKIEKMEQERQEMIRKDREQNPGFIRKIFKRKKK